MPGVGDYVLDNGLAGLKATATHIWICKADPTTYTAATSTHGLGSKNFGAGNVIPGALAAGTPNGRKATTAPVTDGAVTVTDTATHWAIVDATNSRLLAAGPLAASQGVTNGNTWTLPAFDLRLASS